MSTSPQHRAVLAGPADAAPAGSARVRQLLNRGTRSWAVFAYASFVVTALWAVGFLADRWAPTTVDGPGRDPRFAAAVDAALLLVFALQHSVMARPAIKRRLTRIVPKRAQRATYVLATGIVLGLLFGLWQPIPHLLWQVRGGAAAAVWVVYALGWVIAVSSTFMIDHLDFLGLRPAFTRAGYQPAEFTERGLYRLLRHPMMLGLIVAFWATPRMTVGHLLFAAGGTAYILVGIRFEERDLHRELGPEYAAYADRVPALNPLGFTSRNA